MVIFSVYLPPENTNWGRSSDEFFNNLISEIFIHCNNDCLMINGDINARVGKDNDYIVNIDKIKDRIPIDSYKNGHGVELINFLRDCKFCR